MDQEKLSRTFEESSKICRHLDHLRGTPIKFEFENENTSNIIAFEPIKIFEDHFNLANFQIIYVPTCRLENGRILLFVTDRTLNERIFNQE
jgi:hypothetical protein